MRHFFLLVKKIIDLVCVSPPSILPWQQFMWAIWALNCCTLHLFYVLPVGLCSEKMKKKETTCRSGSVWGGSDGWAHPSLCAAHPSRLRKPLFLSWSSRLHSNPSPWSLISGVRMRDNVIFIAACSATCFAAAANNYSSFAVRKTALAASP